MKMKSKAADILRFLILIIPYVIYVLKIIFTLADALTQDGSHWILKQTGLLPEQNNKQSKTPIL